MILNIAPSLFAADAGKLALEIEDVENAGAKYLHIDVMDGHFVPNLSFGPNIVKGIRQHSKMFFDVHLMIEHPLHFCEAFIEAGADIITVHKEIEECIEDIHKICEHKPVKFGIAIRPKTKVNEILDYLDLIDLLLIMGIDPGFGGQQFIPETLDSIKEASLLREKSSTHFLISVDGGVNENNASSILNSGADILVAGTAVFGVNDRKKGMDSIRGYNTTSKTEDEV
jgi:ribulose-phosphate 3-epimerase